MFIYKEMSKRLYDYLVKILILGDSGVGKSSILLRFTDDCFTENFITTIGIDFKIKTIDIDGKKVKIQIWDTAGQERFRTITQAYYRGAHGVFLVYDITNEESFKHIEQWMKDIDRHRDKDSDVKKVLLANKCDLRQAESITKEQGQDLASQFQLPFYEVSAKDESYGSPLNEVFYHLSKEIIKKMDEGSNPPIVPKIPRSPKCCGG